MAKNKETKIPKKGAEAPEVVEEQKDTKPVINLANMSPEEIEKYQKGLDPNHLVDLLKIQHETFRLDPEAEKHTGMPKKVIDEVNKINAAMQVSAIVCEVVLAKNPHTLILPAQLVESMKLVANELGVTLKENLLPAPKADGTVELPSEAIVVNKETKDAVKEEVKIMNELPELNPQKIKDESELRKAAIYVLADTKTNVRPYNRITAAIDLYYSWLYFQAADDAAKEQLKDTPKVDLFRKLVKIIGSCPFSMSGISKILFTTTSRTKTPISAFCMLRNNSLDVTTGRPTTDDHDIADIVRILVEWHAKSLIERDEESIETCNENIKALSKNKKQNKAAIDKENAKIEAYKEAIESYKEVVEIASAPDGHYADVFDEAYLDPKHEDFKTVRRLASEILKTYYGADVDIKSVESESLKRTMKQYVGVILNMFREPGSQLEGYSESDIAELVFKKEEQPAEKPAEEKEEEPKK
jgi:hypothetical protein